MGTFVIEDTIEKLCACTNCGHGPTGHGDDGGHCLFNAETTYASQNPALTWEFWVQMRELNKTRDEINKVNALVDSLRPPRTILDNHRPLNPRYASHMAEIIHQIARGKR